MSARKKRRSVDELLRLACVYAEQDRQTYADACHADDPAHAEALADAREFREYRKRRWGQTRLEQAVAGAKSAPVLPPGDGRRSLKEMHAKGQLR